MELYIHIPFCVRKCLYCDFLSFPCIAGEKVAYLEALHQEILCCGRGREDSLVTSVFVGGGTPSLLTGDEMEGLFGTLRQQFVFAEDAEITMEANPGTLTERNLEGYKKAGIKRLSIGCQSVHDAELEKLGRIHRYADFCESFSLARKAGFTNINVDLMSALPGQDLSSWEDCLQQIIAFSPEHISAYSLIIEEGTPFYDRQDDLKLPEEETERRMYERTREILCQNGYEQYEISNFSRPGFACRHNIGYWDQTPYLGVGLGASSYMDEIRFKNTSNMKDYLCQAKNGVFMREEEEILTLENRMEECMFLGLRMTKGVGISEFREKFGVSMASVYGETIERFVREKLLTICENRVCLTEKGMDLANIVMAEFLLSC